MYCNKRAFVALPSQPPPKFGQRKAEAKRYLPGGIDERSGFGSSNVRHGRPLLVFPKVELPYVGCDAVVHNLAEVMPERGISHARASLSASDDVVGRLKPLRDWGALVTACWGPAPSEAALNGTALDRHCVTSGALDGSANAS